jgi:hypothetical protein
MRPVSPLWTRILGYGGAAVLVVLAVAVVLLQLSAGDPAPPSSGTNPSADAPGAPGSGAAPGAAARPGTAGGTGAAPGPLGTAGTAAATRCGPAAASYRRSGDTVEVSVTVPATGLIAAFVEARGRGTLTKSVTGEGAPGSHVFEFTGVPAAITKHVGVTVILSGGSQTCDLPSPA